MKMATIAIWMLFKLSVVYTEGKPNQHHRKEILNMNHQEVTPLERYFEIQMPRAKPQKEDYLCSGFSVKNMTQDTYKGKVYITSFNVKTNTSKVGHVGLIRCRNPLGEVGEIYSCWDPKKFATTLSEDSCMIGERMGPLLLCQKVWVLKLMRRGTDTL